MTTETKTGIQSVATTQMLQIPADYSLNHQLQSIESFRFPRLALWNRITEIEERIMTDQEDITIVHAPTGEGKTVMMSIICALYSRASGATCSIAMPYRITVIEMYKHLLSYQKAYNELYKGSDTIQFGYAIKDYSSKSRNNDCTLYTTGYFLELLIAMIKDPTFDRTKLQVIFIDEAHDPSWQTHLLLHLVAYAKRFLRIKVIIASATLNSEKVQDIFREGCATYEHVREEPHATFEFLTKDSSGRSYAGLDTLPIDVLELGLVKIVEYVDEIFAQYSFDLHHKRNILVLLPGMKAITAVEELLNNYKKCKGLAYSKIYIIHSVITKEEIEEALTDDTCMCKIFLGTNIMENAITIDKLSYLVDYGYRMSQKIDEDGNIKKFLVKASKSNVIQAQGRIGRQGYGPNKAALLMRRSDYDMLDPFPVSEVEDGPLYNQLLRLYPSFPTMREIIEILHDVPNVVERVFKDTEYLVNKGILILSEDSYHVTPFGTRVRKLKLSIPVACFLIRCFDNGFDKKTLFTAVLIAIFIDAKDSIFTRPRATKTRTKEEHAMELEEKHQRFLDQDTIRTSINAYLCFLNEGISMKTWCWQNGVFEKTFREVCISFKTVSRDIQQLYYNIKSFNTIASLDPLYPILNTVFQNKVLSQEDGAFMNGKKSLDRFAVYHYHYQDNDTIIAFTTRTVNIRGKLRFFINSFIKI